MSWHRVCRLDEITVGSTRAATVDDEELLLCRLEDGSVHALENCCSHDDAPLTDGELDGRTIVCPRHGARFDVTSGAVLAMPAPTEIDVFPVRLTADHWIEVEVLP